MQFHLNFIGKSEAFHGYCVPIFWAPRHCFYRDKRGSKKAILRLVYDKMTYFEAFLLW